MTDTTHTPQPLLGLSLEALGQVAREAGLPPYAARQMARWLYTRRATQISQMTDLPKAARERLQTRYCVGRSLPVSTATSADGTQKHLFMTACGHAVETVYIPDRDRATLCISTQAGCRMRCRFCMTGTLGFHGQLTAADILNQILSVPQAAEITNLVYMGMGEPADNTEAVISSIDAITAPWGMAWSPRRITVSTVGLMPGLADLLDRTQCHIAVSLHHPDSAGRASLMPAERACAIDRTLGLLRAYDWSGQRRLSMEYIVFDQLNDTDSHLSLLARKLRGLNCRINLIPFHATAANAPLKGVSPERMEQIRDTLQHRHHITTTIRRSRGQDIWAACGMLVARQDTGTPQ